MREIKFRLWDTEFKDFYYTDVGFSTCAEYAQLAFDFNDTLPYVRLYDVNDAKLILQQYTGLKDKNGVEIYEGDIINGQDAAIGYHHVKVEWFLGSFLLMRNYKDVYNKDCSIIVGDFHTPFFECEVIGNICENPDLLESKDSENTL